MACGPNLSTPEDFPFEYRRSTIEWAASSTLIYRFNQKDTISLPHNISKEDLLVRLRNQPCFEVEKIRLEDEQRASLELGDKNRVTDLYYEKIAGYLHLWFIHDLDEQYYFQFKTEEEVLSRSFYFYWKKGASPHVEQVYFRVEAGMDRPFHQFIDQQLVYDDFLENGDTLQVIKGYITYRK